MKSKLFFTIFTALIASTCFGKDIRCSVIQGSSVISLFFHLNDAQKTLTLFEVRNGDNNWVLGRPAYDALDKTFKYKQQGNKITISILNTSNTTYTIDRESALFEMRDKNINGYWGGKCREVFPKKI